jgi:L-rhamnose-H+ transport protein
LQHALWLGLALTMAAGLLSGNCMLPMKYARQWQWENTWLTFSVVSLAILPWVLAFAVVHNLRQVYASLPAKTFGAPFGFGFGWGIAQVLFGLSITRLGLALGYAIIIGLGALLGTLVPLLVEHPEVIGTARGGLILCGLMTMVLGIAVSAFAGRARERNVQRTGGGRYGAALALAIVCGVMAPMLNFAFAFGQRISEAAIQHGSSPQAASYAVWPIALLGGLIPNTAYSWRLLSRNRTWRHFAGGWQPDGWLPCLMGVLWMGAFALYGMSSVWLGALGASLGWALFQIFMIMTANFSGVLTGEWKGAPARAKRGLWAGLSLLAIATGVIGAANR